MNTELIVPLLAAAIQSGTPILYATWRMAVSY